tara:strand:- start:543 stop:917 length:375 start_codon:yes stop_codon:yes gene_type:complete
LYLENQQQSGNKNLIISEHARVRMSERLISESNVRSIVRNGKVRKVKQNKYGSTEKYIISAGQLIDLQWSAGLEPKEVRGLRNLTVVAADVGEKKLIITAYRNIHPEDLKAMARSAKIGTCSLN